LSELKNQNKEQFRNYDLRQRDCYKNLKVPENAVIPTQDEGAWEYFTTHRWVYNKLDVALSQEIICGPMGVDPEKFPVFMKPIINMHGMGLGSKLLKTREDYENNRHFSGYFWMEFLEGEHLSYDIVLQNGEVVFTVIFKGHPLAEGMFDSWEISEADEKISAHVTQWVGKHFKDFSGCINIETINGKIIECHLRMGDIDALSDLELMQNIINVYSGIPWKFTKKISDFYLFPIWGDNSIKYELDEKKARELCEDLEYYDLESTDNNPPGGIRLAVIGSYNKEKCLSKRKELSECFNPLPRVLSLIQIDSAN